MFVRLAVLCALAVGWVSAQAYKPDYQNEYVASEDFLLKQKRVFQILYHVTQPRLKADLYKEGQEFKIEVHNYINKDAAKEFLHRLEHGMLPHDTVFSIYYPRIIEETECVFKLMYSAKDFDTFYKTALFLRNRLNHGLFVYSFYLAVIHRPDTKYIRLPAPYEMAPHLFYNDELLEKAHHVKELGQLEEKHSAGYDCYILPYNYSNHYLSDEYNYEQKLNYFTEDIGLNAYYFYLRNQFPFFLSSEEMGWPKTFRGMEYIYGHKQLFARYYLERLSNGLGHIEDYDYSRKFYSGYWPTMSYPNGMQFPSRPRNSHFPRSKFHKIQESREYETRIGQAVDSGIAYTKEGKTAKLYTAEGLNVLGNMIEGNADSCNEQYYGSIDMLGRSILGFNVAPLTPAKLQPSALEHFVTSMRDPAFWRLYKRFFHHYYRFKANQKPYKPEEIQFYEFKIESVQVDKLVTYFDLFDATISNGLAVESEQQAEAYLIQARQHRLNHKPFNVVVSVNAEKAHKVAIRIFLGPKYNVHMQEIDFTEHYHEFYEMDNFIYDLSAGANKITRNCHDFFFVDHEPEPSEVYWQKVAKGIESGEQLKLQKRIFAFPERLLLPKGRPEGMPLQLFVHVAPVQSDPVLYTSRVFGDSLVDDRAYNYPLDRPISEFDFHGANFFFKDVLVYHQIEHDHTVIF
ncbi:arylphorin subunit alpha-like [Phymastichus coffea]|uniref:arylphorin subunit alpha-like n=1 Tax=Phymastichus coffea TaxID=108790 RepID=UPI00273B1CDF|nr:arylphorin subunit alpha-like [Phymastichus coffea]